MSRCTGNPTGLATTPARENVRFTPANLTGVVSERVNAAGPAGRHNRLTEPSEIRFQHHAEVGLTGAYVIQRLVDF